MNAAISTAEGRRLETLRSFDVMDTPPEQAFDDLTLLASQICRAPIALVSLVDANRQWFKSCAGLSATQTPRDESFCTHTIEKQDDLLEVRDAHLDVRFAHLPLVTTGPRVRFYAGAPLVTEDGSVLGALCVMDYTPRSLTDEQRAAMKALSRRVVAQLELRRQARALALEIGERKRSEDELRRQFVELEKMKTSSTQLLAVAERSRRALLSVLEDERAAQTALRNTAALIKDVINSLTAHVVVLDADGKIIETNAAWKKFAVENGMFDPASVGVGSNYLDVCDSSMTPSAELGAHAAADGIRSVLEGSRSEFFLEYLCPLPKEHAWFVMRVVPLTGQRKGVVVAHENITERKLAEISLRDSEERFRRLIENASDVIAVVNGDGRIEFQSPSTQRVLGFSPEEVEGRPVMEFIHPEDREAAMAGIARALSGVTPPAVVEYRIRHRDGTWRIFQSVGRGMTEPGGARRVVVNSRDVTETRKLEEKFRHAQKMEAIGTLAGGIAHDFNNVLAAITGYTELAKMELQGHHEVLEHLQAVSEGSARATDLVRQILAFSRHQGGSERRPISLWPIVDEALKLLRATVPATIQFDVSILRGGPTVLADATQVHQVLMNLVTNAAHAMRDQPGRLGVGLEEFHVEPELAALHPGLAPGNYLRLTVSDTGHGMEAATLQRIFDPFFTTKAPGEGTGLGLAVVHGIMRSHEGVITVYSQPGKGTRFHLYFPAQSGEHSERVAPSGELPRGHGEWILFVDDERPLALMGKKILERLGYRVQAMTTPLEALESVRADPNKYALVVTDLTMPSMRGIELAKSLLQIRPNLPVILTTGYSATLTMEMIREAGIREMLLKPLTIQGLGEAVHRLIA